MTHDPQPRRAVDRSPDGLTIRAERPADEATIASIVEAAFGSSVEARLVSAIRASANFVPELSLVAELDRHVVGHVMVSLASLHDRDIRRPIPNLSPLAVEPSYQRRGIGSALVNAVTERADSRGEPLVVVEGSPAFYGALGFEPSVRYGIRLALPSWAPADAAQVLRLRPFDPSLRGRVVYPPAFDDVSEH